MAHLTDTDITTLAKAAGITIPPHLLTEVGHSVNGLLQALERIDVPELDEVEPLPIIIPPTPHTGS